jgi:GT2 family glycosyltransferase
VAGHRDVLAICVNWNGGEWLHRTVRSLLASSYRPLRLVVVDNDSTDGSFRNLPPGAEVVRMPDNSGYGGAINRIWQEVASGQRREPHYYLLLNNDVLVTEDMLSRLVEFATTRERVICGPKILDWSDPGRLDMAYGYLKWNHVLSRFVGKKAVDGPRWNMVRQVPLLQGSVLLLESSAVQEVGLFDEHYFMYHEEVDFLFRAGRLGYLAYYCPFATASHVGANSTRQTPLKKVFWTRRNTVYFMRKHRARPHQWARFVLTLTGSMIFNVAFLKLTRAATIVKGVYAGFCMPLEEELSQQVSRSNSGKPVSWE